MEALPGRTIYNPYEKDFGELCWFRHGTAFERRYAPRQPLSSARLNADASLLCTASYDKTVRVHEVATGKELKIFKHPDVIHFAKFSSDSKLLCTACDDCLARVYELETGEEVPGAVGGLQHRSRVTSSDFSPDGRLLCTASKDKFARVYAILEEEQTSVEEGAEVDAEGMRRSLTKQFVEQPPPEQQVVDKDAPQSVPKIPTDQPILLTHEDSVLSAAFCREGKRVCCATGAMRFFGAAFVWDMETQKDLFKFPHDDSVTFAEFSADGKWLATASRDKTARIFSLEDGHEVVRFQHKNWLSAVDLSPDRRWILTGCEDGFVRIFDVKNRLELTKLQHPEPVLDAHFGPAQPNPEAAARAAARRMTTRTTKSPALQLCTACADGAARLFGLKT